ncbi:helix-turn-helix transcriptional regulator [Leuconostoc pseudomesenteroides]|uniref:helix-turn-helix domain-containing protein n=1 Tax=Leuconostoc pseudomesenteroides TaxID=33968 RepID=UPI00301DEA14
MAVTKEQFGASIKRIREEKGYTVRQVALWADVSPAYLSRVENAHREIPTPKTLYKIAKGLRISNAEILEYAGIVDETKSVDNAKESISPRQLRVANHIDDNLTDEQLEEVNNFIEYLKQQHKD